MPCLMKCVLTFVLSMALFGCCVKTPGPVIPGTASASSSASSCCTDGKQEASYLRCGLLQDLRSVASFALGIALCHLLQPRPKEGEVDVGSGAEAGGFLGMGRLQLYAYAM